MKRSEALAPLSRDHHVALAVALQLRRCDPASAAAAAERFATFFATHGRRHFHQEEELLLPILEDAHPADAERLVADHRAIGEGAPPEPDALHALGERLADHVRWEERELFPLLEAELAPERLAEIGQALHPH